MVQSKLPLYSVLFVAHPALATTFWCCVLATADPAATWLLHSLIVSHLPLVGCMVWAPVCGSISTPCGNLLDSINHVDNQSMTTKYSDLDARFVGFKRPAAIRSSLNFVYLRGRIHMAWAPCINTSLRPPLLA